MSSAKARAERRNEHTMGLLEVVSQPPDIFYNDGPAKKFTVSITWQGDTPMEYRHPVLQYADQGKEVENQTILKALDGPFAPNSNAVVFMLQPKQPVTFTFRINEVSSRHNHKAFRLCFCSGTHECFTHGIIVRAKKPRLKADRLRKQKIKQAEGREEHEVGSKPVVPPPSVSTASTYEQKERETHKRGAANAIAGRNSAEKKIKVETSQVCGEAESSVAATEMSNNQKELLVLQGQRHALWTMRQQIDRSISECEQRIDYLNRNSQRSRSRSSSPNKSGQQSTRAEKASGESDDPATMVAEQLAALQNSNNNQPAANNNREGYYNNTAGTNYGNYGTPTYQTQSQSHWMASPGGGAGAGASAGEGEGEGTGTGKAMSMSGLGLTPTPGHTPTYVGPTYQPCLPPTGAPTASGAGACASKGAGANPSSCRSRSNSFGCGSCGWVGSIGSGSHSLRVENGGQSSTHSVTRSGQHQSSSMGNSWKDHFIDREHLPHRGPINSSTAQILQQKKLKRDLKQIAPQQQYGSFLDHDNEPSSSSNTDNTAPVEAPVAVRSSSNGSTHSTSTT